MGIYFEHKLLVPDINGSEIQQKYFVEQEKVRKIFRDFGGSISLKRDGDPIWDIKRKSYRPFVPFSLPVEAYINLPSMGSVSVRYSKAAPIRVDKKYIYNGNRIFLYDRLHLNEDQIDLAWFLIMASKFVEITDADGNVVKSKGGNRFLKIDNPMVEVRKHVSENKNIARLDRLVYFDDSPIYNMDAANHIASQFGLVLNAPNIDMAMHQIRSAVLAGEKSNNPLINIDKFVTFCTQLGRKEYSKDWDGEIPEDGFNQLQVESFSYGSLKRISKELGLELGQAPKKEILVREIMNHFTVQA